MKFDAPAEIDLLRERCKKAEEQLYRLTMGLPRFANVSCSQCGCDFGPGDHGFSHCQDHKRPPERTSAAVLAEFITRVLRQCPRAAHVISAVILNIAIAHARAGSN